jgi:DNA topoisomerase-1
MIYILPSLGHLYTLNEPPPSSFDKFPTFSIIWTLDLNSPRKRRTVLNMSKLFRKLSAEANELVNACDYDIEGSTLGYNIINYLCNTNGDKTITRMKFSSLTRNELIESFRNRKAKLDGNYYTAGITRHIIDFIWGVNLTRALSILAKKRSGFHSTISIGRVQGPTLKFIVDRERDIRAFVPAPYWEAEAYFVTEDNNKFKAAFVENPIETQAAVDRLDKEVNKDDIGIVENIKFRKRKYMPPTPFNLTDLQSEAYINFGFKPSRTLAIAEQLYLDALITYPRTSSQQYPKDIDHKAILGNLMKLPDYKGAIKPLLSKTKLSPREGKKTDPAHPAIYPTGELPSQSIREDAKKLYDLIVRRYISTFLPPVELKSVSANIRVNDYLFIVRGRTIEKEGWLAVYGSYSQISEDQIPELSEGDKVIADDL